MLGQICYIKTDTKKEKYIVFNTHYGSEVVDIIGINESNRGKVLQLRGVDIEIDKDAQAILEKL